MSEHTAPDADRQRIFLSLRTHNYRLFFSSQLVSVSGNWMQTVAMAFLVLQLTGSGTDLGFAIAARFLPVLLFGPWGGLIADRGDRRRILLTTQVLSGLVALAYGLLDATGVITMPIVYGLAAAFGMINVFDNPARQLLIAELVPPHQLRNAVALNSVTVNVARVLGSAVGGGIAAALGLSLCFELDAASFVVVVVGLLLMRRDEIFRGERASREPGQIRAGIRYVASTPALLTPLTMILVVGTLAWEFQVSLPLVATRTFHSGPDMTGLLLAAMGAGAVLGGLRSAAMRSTQGIQLSLAAAGWGVAIVLEAIAPNPALAYVLMVPVGYFSVTFNSTAKTYLQLAAAPAMRGRVMALWALVWMGSTPLGGPIIGFIGEHFGGRWCLLAGGLPTLAVGLATASIMRRLDRAAGSATP